MQMQTDLFQKGGLDLDFPILQTPYGPQRPHRYPHGEAPALTEKAIHPLGKNRRGKTLPL